MSEEPRYSKASEGYSLRYQPLGVDDYAGEKFVLRVSLGEMLLEDAFEIDLPANSSDVTVGDLLSQVFPEQGAESEEISGNLDVRANPDLPDIYDAMLDVFGMWRDGYSELKFFSNNGPEIGLFDKASRHLSLQHIPGPPAKTEPVLDLVVERTFNPMASFVERGGDRDDFLAWLRGAVFLYFMDKHGFSYSVRDADDDDPVTLIADDLQQRDLITLNSETGGYEISVEGRGFLGQLIVETEGYIDRYDIFKDVDFDLDDRVVDFDTGRGRDLRVQIYENEGIDPYMTVFLLRVYDGTLDAYMDTWTEVVSTDGFFDEILLPVLDHQRVDGGLLDWIIESGLALMEERAEASRDKSDQASVRRRIQPP